MFLQKWVLYIIEHIAFFSTAVWLTTKGIPFMFLFCQIVVIVCLAIILDPFITSKLKGIHEIKTYRESFRINFPLLLSSMVGISVGMLFV